MKRFHVFVLAFEGCRRNERPDGSLFDSVTAPRVLDLVGRGAQMRMQMFVISLAGSDAALAEQMV